MVALCQNSLCLHCSYVCIGMQSWHVCVQYSMSACFSFLSVYAFAFLFACLNRLALPNISTEFGVFRHLTQLARCVLFYPAGWGHVVLPHLVEMHFKARLLPSMSCPLLVVWSSSNTRNVVPYYVLTFRVFMRSSNRWNELQELGVWSDLHATEAQGCIWTAGRPIVDFMWQI